MNPFLALAIHNCRSEFQSKGVMPSVSDIQTMHLSGQLGRRSGAETDLSGASVVAGGSASGESHADEPLWIAMPGGDPEFQKRVGGAPSRGAEPS